MRRAVTPWLVLGLCLQGAAPAPAHARSAEEPAESADAEPGEPAADDGEGDGADADSEGEPAAEVPAPETSEGAPAPAPAAAAGSSGLAGVAVLPLLVSGELAEAANGALLERLRKGIERGSFVLIDQPTTNSIAATGCSDDACYERMEKEANATYIVRTTISVADRDYQVKIDLVDLRSGNTVASSAESCELCGVAEVGSVLEAQGAQLGKKLEDLVKEPPTLTIAAEPQGALVMVDGEVVGVAPIAERQMLAGKHVVRVSYDGYIPEEREIESIVGVNETVNVQLKRTPESKRFRALGWASWAVGVPILVGGIPLLVLDEQLQVRRDECMNLPYNPDLDVYPCVYVTRYAGAAMIAVGAALTTAGAMLLVRYSDRKGKAKRKRSKTTARARPRISPTGFGISGRF